MSNADTTDAPNANLTTAADIVRRVNTALDEHDFSAYDPEVRQSIHAAAETLVQTEQSAHLAVDSDSDDPDADLRRTIISDLAQSTSFSKEAADARSRTVLDIDDNLEDARAITDDLDGLTVVPRLLEMFAVLPSRTPKYRGQQGAIKNRLDGSAGPLLEETFRYVLEKGSRNSNSEYDPCPWYGPTGEEIEEKRSDRADRRAELEAELSEAYLGMSEYVDQYIKAATEWDAFVKSNREHLTNTRIQSRTLLAVCRARKDVKQADETVQSALIDSLEDASNDVREREIEWEQNIPYY